MGTYPQSPRQSAVSALGECPPRWARQGSACAASTKGRGLLCTYVRGGLVKALDPKTLGTHGHSDQASHGPLAPNFERCSLWCICGACLSRLETCVFMPLCRILSLSKGTEAACDCAQMAGM